MNVFNKMIRCKVPVLQGNLSSKTRFNYSTSLRFKSRIADDFEASLAEISHYKNDNIQWYCGSNIAMRYATYFQRVQRGIAR